MTPTTYELLANLRERGIRLRVVADCLQVCPHTAVGDELRVRLIDHKGDLIRILLLDVSPNELPGDLRCDWEERSAIREHDGGQLREHAEHCAMMEVIARLLCPPARHHSIMKTDTVETDVPVSLFRERDSHG